MKNKLTTQSYWESYYKSNHATIEHINTVCSRYDRFWNLFINSESEGKHIIEIGGFPGRFLAYLSSKYRLKPTCLDYNSDVGQVKSTFEVMDIEDYHIVQTDFTSYETKETYDYVMSNGFIEHFEDFDHILDQHVLYLNKGGRLYVMIPNMRGYIRFYKYLVDYSNMTIHNLKCMKLRVFKDFAERHNLNIRYLSYFGGFPFGVHQKLNLLQKLIYKGHRLVFKKLNKSLEKHPNRFLSSSIVAIFEKN